MMEASHGGKVMGPIVVYIHRGYIVVPGIGCLWVTGRKKAAIPGGLRVESLCVYFVLCPRLPQLCEYLVERDEQVAR